MIKIFEIQNNPKPDKFVEPVRFHKAQGLYTKIKEYTSFSIKQSRLAGLKTGCIS
jgi:hypothetical protein